MYPPWLLTYAYLVYRAYYECTYLSYWGPCANASHHQVGANKTLLSVVCRCGRVCFFVSCALPYFIYIYCHHTNFKDFPQLSILALNLCTTQFQQRRTMCLPKPIQTLNKVLVVPFLPSSLTRQMVLSHTLLMSKLLKLFSIHPLIHPFSHTPFTPYTFILQSVQSTLCTYVITLLFHTFTLYFTLLT